MPTTAPLRAERGRDWVRAEAHSSSGRTNRERSDGSQLHETSSPTYELGGVCKSRLTRHGLEAGAVCHGREMNDPMPGVESPSRAGGEEE
jgi:hypothetical protein